MLKENAVHKSAQRYIQNSKSLLSAVLQDVINNYIERKRERERERGGEILPAS
jgi:hypothetical protein